MDIKTLQKLVVDALEDVKAQDIRIFDTAHLTSLFDRIAIVSGTSNRQTRALAASVRDKVKENGGDVLSIEGEDTGEWVLVDLGDMVIHIMQPAIRDYYRLEEIWGDKEVRLGAAKRTSARVALGLNEEDAPKKRPRHLVASQALPEEVDTPAPKPRKPAPKKTAAGAAVPAGKRVRVATPKAAAPKKTTASKSATPKKTATKRTAKPTQD